MASVSELSLCALCGKTFHSNQDNEVRGLDSSTVLKYTFRLLNIHENFPVKLDEETGLVADLNQFCPPCVDVAQTLKSLYDEIDALNEHVSRLRELLKRNILRENSSNVIEITNEGAIIRTQPKLKHFLCEKLKAEELAVKQDLPEYQLVSLEEDNFGDDYLPEESLDGSDFKHQEASSSLANDTTNEEEEESGTSASLKRDAFVLVKRLSAEEIRNHTKKGKRGRRKKKNPVISERKAKKIQEKLAALEANQNKFFCPVADCKRKSGFDSELHLECHVAKIHQGLTHPYTCKDCGRKFKQPRPYELHLKTHKGEYPFFCKFCGVGCLNSWALGIHEIRHTGELRYKCKLCPKAYRGHNGLKYHVRMTHTKEKPYTCDSCGKCFAQMDKLKRHMHAVHQTERPWVCHQCGKTFPISNYLYMHTRSVHQKQPFPKDIRKQNQTEASAATEEIVPVSLSEFKPESDAEQSSVAALAV